MRTGIHAFVEFVRHDDRQRRDDDERWLDLLRVIRKFREG